MGGHLKPEFPPLLVAGFHPKTVAEVRALCVDGFVGSLTRALIMDRLTEVVRKLSAAGITGELWVDGSFVTEKIDPEDVDTLLRVSSDQYDNDPTKQRVIDWASEPALFDSHSCDAYKWVEWSKGHPLHSHSKAEGADWTEWFGHSRRHVPKGIVVVRLPVPAGTI